MTDASKKLYSTVRFVQSTDSDYHQVSRMFDGSQDGYCEANSQPVINFLKEWDDNFNKLEETEPRIANGDTRYSDENGVYTLLYNSSVGGCFLLYREANEEEWVWMQQKELIKKDLG